MNAVSERERGQVECNRIDSAGAAGDLDDELLVVVLNLLSFPSISSKRDPLPNIYLY